MQTEMVVYSRRTNLVVFLLSRPGSFGKHGRE